MTPEAKGSSVPVWPIFFICVRRRNCAMRLKLVGPIGLLTGKIPSKLVILKAGLLLFMDCFEFSFDGQLFVDRVIEFKDERREVAHDNFFGSEDGDITGSRLQRCDGRPFFYNSSKDADKNFSMLQIF